MKNDATATGSAGILPADGALRRQSPNMPAGSRRSQSLPRHLTPNGIPQILFYLGYDNGRGGICSFLRALAGASAPHFEMMLGMNAGAGAHGAQTQSPAQPALPVIEFPRIAGETISLRTLLRARTVARVAREWLHADTPSPSQPRIFHGCSRAGLLVALWLARWGERRVCATVHCYGRQRWFYRHAARVLGPRLKFLSPAMAAYYGLPSQNWGECLPPCIFLGARAACPRNESDESFASSSRAGCPRSQVIRAAGIGALVRIKRWHLVLEALAQLPADVRARWQFTHIGTTDGSRASERCARFLRERTRALGLDAQVRWLGQQPSSAPLLAESDVLIVPADREALSLARVEALAAGVPSVSADSGAARDFILPSTPPAAPPVNGWLFRNNDDADLARVLARLSAPDALAAVRIDRNLLRRFTPEGCAAQHALLYEKILQAPDCAC